MLKESRGRRKELLIFSSQQINNGRIENTYNIEIINYTLSSRSFKIIFMRSFLMLATLLRITLISFFISCQVMKKLEFRNMLYRQQTLISACCFASRILVKTTAFPFAATFFASCFVVKYLWFVEEFCWIAL